VKVEVNLRFRECLSHARSFMVNTVSAEMWILHFGSINTAYKLLSKPNQALPSRPGPQHEEEEPLLQPAPAPLARFSTSHAGPRAFADKVKIYSTYDPMSSSDMLWLIENNVRPQSSCAILNCT